MPARNQKPKARKSTASVPKIKGVTAGASAQTTAQQGLEIRAAPQFTLWAEPVFVNRATAPTAGRTDHAPTIPD